MTGAPVTVPPEEVCDFFVSYSGADRPKAEWIANVLEDAQYKTVLQSWDFGAGSNFVLEMHWALIRAKRMIALLSAAYLASVYAAAEWAAVWRKDPMGEERLLVPVRFDDVMPVGLLATIPFVDLQHKNDADARAILLEAVHVSRERRTAWRPAAATPQAAPPPLVVSNAPPPSPFFVGREDVLDTLRTSLAAVGPPGRKILPAAIHGPPGVGKTQVAARLAADAAAARSVVWWVRAHEPSVLRADLAALATKLGLAPGGDDTTTLVNATADWLRRSSGWLLVFDGLADFADIDGVIPVGGTSRVVVTTRLGAGLRGVSQPILLEPFGVEEAAAFLVARTNDPEETVARELAAALDRLPLALVQAAAYVDANGLSLREYRDRLDGASAPMLPTPDYPQPLAVAWRLAIEAVDDEAARDLLHVLAFLDHGPLPVVALQNASAVLPAPLGPAAAVGTRLDELIGVLMRRSLVVRRDGALSVQASLQESLRALLGAEQGRHWSTVAVRVVLTAMPDDPEKPVNWPAWEVVLPHLLAATAHAERLGAGGLATARVLVRGARYLRSKAERGPARKLYERAIAIFDAAPDRDEIELAAALSELGSEIWRLGSFEESQRAYERALELRQRHLAPDHAAIADSLDDIGTVLQRRALYARAAQLHTDALAIRRAAGTPQVGEPWVSLNNLGIAQWRAGELRQATTTLAEAETSLRNAGVADPVVLGVVASNIGSVAASQGNLGEAASHLQRAHALLVARLGQSHTKVAAVSGNVGALAYRTGEAAAAEAHLERAALLFERFYGADNPATALILTVLGLVHQARGDLVLARAEQERSLGIRRTKFGADHPAVGVALHNLGLVVADMGDFTAAVELHQQAADLFERTLGPTHRDLGIVLLALGWDHQRRRDHEAARRSWRRAQEMLAPLLGTDQPLVAYARDLGAGAAAGDGPDRSGPRGLGLERYSALFFTS